MTWKKIKATQSGRPFFDDIDEVIVYIQDDIGLYQDNTKLDKFQTVRFYLTNKRLIFINELFPEENYYILLHEIQEVSLYQGFINSSPKLILDLVKTEGEETKRMYRISWICTICSFSNHVQLDKPLAKFNEANNEINFKCSMCGIKPERLILKDGSSKADSFEPELKPVEATTASKRKHRCPQCTFVNHPSMLNCEMCNFPLRDKDSFDDSDILLGSKDSTTFKLSFHDKKVQPFSDKLQHYIEKSQHDFLKRFNRMNMNVVQQPASPVGPSKETPKKGIHDLENNSSNFIDSSFLNDSLSGLGRLMRHAEKLIRLSESMKPLMMNLHQCSHENHQLISLLKSNKPPHKINNGIIVESDTKKSLYHKEVARQLVEFILNYDLVQNDFISLCELYKLYNKSRGLNLLSPSTFKLICEQLENVNSIVKLYQIEYHNNNSFYIISKTSSTNYNLSNKVNTLLEENPSDLKQLQIAMNNCNFSILKSVVDELCSEGVIVLDQSIGGNVYYINHYF
ncbi:Vacuolar protein-sorting-associated protein 36 [Komagataella phaffii CBS 7435]|uniref:Vacuolar protein-sorting-associated protein 36 n=2 Tax=Komagataella phaffii TaxID=460519 RepID=C4R466_KOMPG|nr:Component of the ESCRT-II complex [Komagataella phaffii GS115]AOA63584.1 GQ67_03372T0 [Komagataella phaffii]CAH2449901.1 Vacuolar protein-sorting-associated protein 36 [Komagataella phaffii CBS 7435]AOA69233.1 GQ68_03341T0 [Komagataella phaffii GS115]CAY70352.1 Component of the ESCRT-II complex [Komagataella phaffii GS115]CCA39855.1 Vacuolar protein-sorting-associated protein 36 [Komagataella phaffii CBS 7435]